LPSPAEYESPIDAIVMSSSDRCLTRPGRRHRGAEGGGQRADEKSRRRSGIHRVLL
jgi:hypothetical protein